MWRRCTPRMSHCPFAQRLAIAQVDKLSARSVSTKPHSASFERLVEALPAPKTVDTVYQAAVTYLHDRNVPEPDTSARYLLSQTVNIGYSPSSFYEHLQRVLSTSELEVFIAQVGRRAFREPVQYILGDWEFYGLTFLCRAPVLIPRPETEELVDLVLESLGAHPDAIDPTSLMRRNHPWRILDIGAGSGVLGITLLTLLPHATCTAIDIDPQAIALSSCNASRLLSTSPQTCQDHSSSSSRYRLINCSIQELAERSEEHGSYDLIVSNPPYIPSEELYSLETEVLQFESGLALHGGKDGLDVVRDILRLTPPLLSTGGIRRPGIGTKSDIDRNNKSVSIADTDNNSWHSDSVQSDKDAVLWMEVSHTHPQKIEQIVKNCLLLNVEGSQRVNSSSNLEHCTDATFPYYVFAKGVSDLYGQPRFVKLQLQTKAEAEAGRTQTLSEFE